MNFETAVQSMSDAGVEFIIIGGWSAILHGSVHVTNQYAARVRNFARSTKT
jgi:hypothetical protein